MGACNSNLEADVRNLETENRELYKQINSLKNINLIQENLIRTKKNHSEINSLSENIPTKKIVDVSKDKLNDYIDKLLENSDTNISYLPDFVEKKIYTNILGIALNILDDILETTSINFIGHKITLDLTADN